MEPTKKPECNACGADDHEGELRECPHCGGTKCSICDMGDEEECEYCGTKLIARCLQCGAPVCCPKCCNAGLEDVKNWTQDLQHENGFYQCACVDCGELFYGHKHRVVCQTCATSNVEVHPPAASSGSAATEG